ncbi:uncharacterized protein LOC111315209 [Durio zibethinus]|uniref:Uncharacterized protein LOC111315209 n=1 Tax=Durio zibethinus TaxID=66656 RepID=A0A6P6B659_DURZI|nr:uncharacterized protein LOC111315209 [Durio zibethinus]
MYFDGATNAIGHEIEAILISSLKGEWETRDSKLIPYHKYILELCKQFKTIQFEHLPCEENQIVDALAILAVMVRIGDTNQQYPDQATKNDKRILKRLAMIFFLDGEVLYKQGKDQVLLRCVKTVSFTTVTRSVIYKFIKKEIIYKYGLPKKSSQTIYRN